jgi:hypothetical protein
LRLLLARGFHFSARMSGSPMAVHSLSILRPGFHATTIKDLGVVLRVKYDPAPDPVKRNLLAKHLLPPSRNRHSAEPGSFADVHFLLHKVLL